MELSRDGGVDDEGDDDYAGESFDLEEDECEEREEEQIQDHSSEMDKGKEKDKVGDHKVKSIGNKDPSSSNKMRRQMREMVMRAVNHVTTNITNNTGNKARAETGIEKLPSSRGWTNITITMPYSTIDMYHHILFLTHLLSTTTYLRCDGQTIGPSIRNHRTNSLPNTVRRQ